MNRITISCGLIFGSLFTAQSQDNKYLPKGSSFEIVSHTNYVLGYSEKQEQALWVSYELLASEVYGSVARTDNFRVDPSVSSGSAELADYRGSGYDRGHLAPAADMAFNKTAMSESFFLSNMSPQRPGFNRGIWKELESQVRKWAHQKGNVYVVTGGLFAVDQEYIGSNKVSVPVAYFKALLSDDQAVALVLPHIKDKVSSWSDYMLSIDDLESQSGLDFFTELPNEEKIEAAYDASHWPDQVGGSKPKTQVKQGETAVRCEGIAKSTNQRCKIQTTNANKHCRYHQSQAKN